MGRETGSGLLAILSVIAFIAVLIFVWGDLILPAWDKYVNKYEKPWWTGTQNLRVCDAFDASKCYRLPVTSNGEQVVRVDFPNGGYLVPQNATCAKVGMSAYAVDRFCSVLDQSGKEWDIIPD